MTPWQLAKSGTEHGEQAAFFAWANRAMWVGFICASDPAYWADTQPLALTAPAWPELRWLYAIPNGGERAAAIAGQMKAEGVKAGVADIFWPVAFNGPKFGRHGLYIEMKRRNGRPSDLKPNQLEFRQFVLAQGYAWCWARGWEQARDRLIAYATGKWTEEMEAV